MQRRRTLAVLAATASTIAGPLRPGFARAAAADDSSGGDGGLAGALQAYRALPGTKSYLIQVGPGASLGRVASRPSLSLFTASAYKTFVLGQYPAACCDGQTGRETRRVFKTVSNSPSEGSNEWGRWNRDRQL